MLSFDAAPGRDVTSPRGHVTFVAPESCWRPSPSLDRASALVCVTPHSEPAQVGGSGPSSRRQTFSGFFYLFFPVKIGLLLCRTLVLSVMSADMVRLTCEGLACRQQDTGEEPGGGAGAVSSR